MARALRIQRPGGRYHVTARGNDRRDIFRDEGDHFHFLELLGELGERYGVRVHTCFGNAKSMAGGWGSSPALSGRGRLDWAGFPGRCPGLESGCAFGAGEVARQRRRAIEQPAIRRGVVRRGVVRRGVVRRGVVRRGVVRRGVVRRGVVDEGWFANKRFANRSDRREGPCRANGAQLLRLDWAGFPGRCPGLESGCAFGAGESGAPTPKGD